MGKLGDYLASQCGNPHGVIDHDMGNEPCK